MNKRIAWLATASLLPFVCSAMVNAAPTPAKKAQATQAKAAKKAPAAAHRPSEIATLKSQLQAVMNRLKQLETCQPAAPVCAPAAPAAVCPPKGLTVLQDGREGVRLVELITHTPGNYLRVNLTGQINKALWYANNGNAANLQIVDNNASSTRFSLIAEGDLTPTIIVGGVIMEEILQNSSNLTDINNGQNAEVYPTTRKAEVYVVNKCLGTVLLGHGYMASFEKMQDTDYSGTTAATAGEKISLNAAAVRFFNSSTDEISSGLTGTGSAYTVGRVLDNSDGLGRRDRIRYNSPSLYGFSIQGGYAFDTVGTMWDAGLRFQESWGKTKVGASIFFEHTNRFGLTASTGGADFNPYLGKTNTHYKQFNGSIGALFSNGISIQLAGAWRKWGLEGARDSKLGFVKLGYQTQFFCEGKTAFAVDAGVWRDFFLNTTYTGAADEAGTALQRARLRQHHTGTAVGAELVQFFDRVNTELYLSGRVYKMQEGHINGSNRNFYKPVHIVMLGARVSF